MFGIDRSGIWIFVELEPDVILAKLCRYFKKDYEEKISRKSQILEVDNEFIEKFRVSYKPKGARIEIYFNYSKAFDKTNLHPLTGEFKKIFVEERIIGILKNVLGNYSSNWKMDYFNLEAAAQFKTSSIHHYHKTLRFIFRALSENYRSNDKCYYSDYSLFFKKFLDTGFTFQLAPGIKFKIYAKGIEHNKKTKENTRETSLRGELTLTTNGIKEVVGTTDVSTVTLELLEKKVADYFLYNLEIHKKFEKTFINDIRYLEEKFENFNSRELKSMVISYGWRGLDDKVFCYVIESCTNKSISQVERYRRRIREALIEDQERGESKKSNFGNLRRLEELMMEIFLLDIEINLKKNHEIYLFLQKNPHKYAGNLHGRKALSPNK